MKPTLITFFTTLLMTFALSACTQDQGETGGMGQAGDSGYDTGDTSVSGGSDSTQRQQDSGRMSDDPSVDLPQESPAAGGQSSPGTSPDTGAQSPGTTSSPGSSSGMDSQSPSGTDSPEPGTTSSPGTPGVESTPPASDDEYQQEDELQRQDERPMTN